MIPETREMLHGIALRTLRAQVQRSEVTDFLQRVRDLRSQKRSVNGAELGIPDTLLPILRDTTERYSKLYSYLHVTPLKGTARQNIAGAIPEAVWTEALGKLNELDIDFSQIELDGYMVGGFVVVPNPTLEDDDNLELLATVIDYLGQAIGKAVDKASVYGDGDNKPVGYVTRLALDKDNQVIGYEFVSLGKMTDFIKKGLEPNEAWTKAMGHYGRFSEEQGAVKYIDPRKE